MGWMEEHGMAIGELGNTVYEPFILRHEQSLKQSTLTNPEALFANSDLKKRLEYHRALHVCY